jgi:hypothetical protein
MNVSFDEEKENNSCCDSDLFNQPSFLAIIKRPKQIWLL